MKLAYGSIDSLSDKEQLPSRTKEVVCQNQVSRLEQSIDLAEEINCASGEVVQFLIRELLVIVKGSLQSRLERIRLELSERTLEAAVELLKCLVHAGLWNAPHDV